MPNASLEAIKWAKVHSPHIIGSDRLAVAEAYDAGIRAAQVRAGVGAEMFGVIRAAYVRGAEWAYENGPDFKEYRHKAAYDYADKATAPVGADVGTGADLAAPPA